MNRLGLSFMDSELEVGFLRSYPDKTIGLVRFALVVGCLLYAAFGILDAMAAGHAARQVWLIRYAIVCPFLALCALGAWAPALRESVHGIFLSAALVAGLGIVAMITVLEPPASDAYYAGLILVLMFNYTLGHVRFLHATLVGWVLLAAYEIPTLVVHDTDPAILVSNSFFFVAANLLGMVAAYFIERSRRTEYVQRRVIDRDRDRLSDLAVRLEELATRDGLTGLLNRRQLEQRLREAIRMCSRYKLHTSLILLDIDDFKDVNDTLGHPAGDTVLRRYAEVLKDAIRSTDMAFRFGGDEFLVMLPNTSPDVAAILGRRLMIALQQVDLDGLPEASRPTVSVGIGAVPPEANETSEALSAVDEALYQAKAGGKGRLFVQLTPNGPGRPSDTRPAP